MSNIYVANIGVPQCIKQTLTDTRGETKNDTIIIGDFSTPLTTMDRFSRKLEIPREHFMQRWAQ